MNYFYFRLGKVNTRVTTKMQRRHPPPRKPWMLLYKPAFLAMDPALTTQSLISKMLKAGDYRSLSKKVKKKCEEEQIRKKEKNLLTRNYIILLMRTNQLCIRFA